MFMLLLLKSFVRWQTYPRTLLALLTFKLFNENFRHMECTDLRDEIYI